MTYSEDEISKEDIYEYILLKIKFIKNDIDKLKVLMAFLDAVM